MKFSGKLEDKVQGQVEQADGLLSDPLRLAALKRSQIMNTPKERAFDRLAELAAKVLKVPLTIVSLVSDEKQFFKAGYGLPAPYDTIREIPIDNSICRYTLRGDAIIAEDSKLDPLLMFHPTTEPWGIAAFIAIPMITYDGHVLGAFCAVDTKPRPWSEEDIELMRELTASVMTEIHLREQVGDLNAEKELRERFVATLTHDLRTPLAAAKLSAQFLARSLPDNTQALKISNRITQNMDRADRMIQDLLDASRIRANEKVPLDFMECNLNEIADGALEDLKTVHGDQFVFEAQEEIQGIWDGVALRRLLDNLLSNAVKYGAKNKLITLSLKRNDETVEISIHNHGNPIPQDEQKNIFEPFYRAQSASKSAQKGWGLGLALVKGLANAHGGKVDVTSSVADGTSFIVTLPRISSSPSIVS